MDRIDESGWTLEVAIPFRQIRFSKDEEPEMGIAVQRTINRKNERVIWPFILLNFQGGIIRVSQYATLRGLRGWHEEHGGRLFLIPTFEALQAGRRCQSQHYRPARRH